MKFTDRYDAKYTIWAQESKVHPLPRMVTFPPFKSRKFSSYKAFNAWKRGLLIRIAEQGGIKWTK